MYLTGPREVCVCITFSREAWIEGPAGGRGGDSTRNESGLERERETNMTSRRFKKIYKRRHHGVLRETKEDVHRIFLSTED